MLKYTNYSDKGGYMAELEYRINVSFIYSDGRRESITVFRRAQDEEACRLDVWHEYRNRFPDVNNVCLTTNLTGVNLPSGETAQGAQNSAHPQPPPFSDYPEIRQPARPSVPLKNPRL